MGNTVATYCNWNKSFRTKNTDHSHQNTFKLISVRIGYAFYRKWRHPVQVWWGQTDAQPYLFSPSSYQACFANTLLLSRAHLNTALNALDASCTMGTIDTHKPSLANRTSLRKIFCQTNDERKIYSRDYRFRITCGNWLCPPAPKMIAPINNRFKTNK